jgi:GMP synthase-like glutamine amidotransferase
MKHRTLIVDCTREAQSFGCKDLTSLVAEACGARSTLFTRRAPCCDLPAVENFDQIVVSGSLASPEAAFPWLLRLKDFVREVLARSIPYLGVCFGHQLLASVLGAPVGLAPLPQIGWVSLRTQPCSLFEGVPSPFFSFSHHFEEIQALPADTKLLAHSRGCAWEAIQWKDLPVYGIQFHPEKTQVQAQALLKKYAHLPLLHPNHREAPLWGPTILRNAFRL